MRAWMQAKPWHHAPSTMLLPANVRLRGGLRFTAAAEVALGLLVFACAFALGGTARGALWILWALAGAAALITCFAALRREQPLAVPAFSWILLAAAAACALQLVPLPPRALDVLSPPAAELRDAALQPLGLAAARPLSLDPPSTARELVKALAYAAVVFAAAQLARSRRTRRRLFAAIALCGASIAAVGLIHEALGLHALFGLVPFEQARPPLLTPFGNANHLAAFLTLSGALCLALSLSATGRREGLAWAGAFAITSLAVLLSFSRAGVAFFALTQLVFAALAIRFRQAGGPEEATDASPAPEVRVRRRRHRRHSTERERGGGLSERILTALSRAGAKPALESRAVWAALAAAAALGVGCVLALDRLIAEFSSADTLEKLKASKVELWPAFARAAARFWPFGMGRGAFAQAYTRFQDRFPGNLFSHPENAPLQWAAELGIPVALGLAVAAAFALRGVTERASRSPLDLAALCGLMGLALHDLFDFALELPATAVAAAVALGCLCRPRDEAAATAAPAATEVPRGSLAPVLATAGLMIAAGAALGWGRSTVSRARAELNALNTAGAPAAEVEEAARRHIDRHPSDYLLYNLVGRAYARAGEDPRIALAYVSRALFLRPLDSEAHRTAARALLRLGRREQAFVEYRLAASGVDPGPFLDEAARAARGVDELAALTPEHPERIAGISRRLTSWGRREEAIGLLQRVTASGLPPSAHSAELWTLLAAYSLDSGRFEQAERAADEAQRLDSTSLQPLLLKARALRAMGEPEQAVEALEQRAAREPAKLELALALGDHLLSSGRPSEALDALERVSPHLANAGERSQWMAAEARIYEVIHKPAKAADLYRSAARLSPGSPHLHYALGRLYESIGRPTDAIRAVSDGMRADSAQGGAQVRTWLDRLREKERAQRIEAAARGAGGSGRPLDLDATAP